ncbi:MAG: hypothetical protein ABIC91_08330 [Nanoarchaeota archaeon]|nr:hypothetical protein [Nanoarchaeota archaeon]MBU1030959.1 hypothetical protein [Nanoarchaeota archaeon]MBU1849884.1 hypothetical protein [Nanoarchaeota archaeon]
MSENDRSSSSSNGCCCSGCLKTTLIGTAIVGAIALGGLKPLWLKLKSTWDYDNKKQQAESIINTKFGNNNHIIELEEKVMLYRQMKIPTINNEIPTVKVPYRKYVDFVTQYK